MQDHVINEKAVAYIKIYYFSFSHYTGTCGGLCCGVKTTDSWDTSANKKRHISFSTKPMTNMKFDRMLDFNKELLTIKLLDSSLAS